MDPGSWYRRGSAAASSATPIRGIKGSWGARLRLAAWDLPCGECHWSGGSRIPYVEIGHSQSFLTVELGWGIFGISGRHAAGVVG
jgi:hypothetical protein